MQIGTLPHFLDQWSGITSNRFVLNMVKGLHLQLRARPLLFSHFHQFSIKAASAHQLVVLVPIPMWFVVPMHLEGLHPILNLK